MSPAAGIGARKTRLKRYWADAEHKRGECRIAGCEQPGELHHLSGRANDPERDCPWCEGDCLERSPGLPDDTPCETCHGTGMVLYVRADSVAPLCPAHHTAHHTQGKLDLSPHLTNEEAACVVLDLGLERAYRTLTGSRNARAA